MVPSIKIEIIGNRCNCCESSEKREYRVAYRSDSDVFVAVDECTQASTRAVLATFHALNETLIEKYDVGLQQVAVGTSLENLPLLREVAKIEEAAQEIFRNSRPEIGSAKTNRDKVPY